MRVDSEIQEKVEPQSEKEKSETKWRFLFTLSRIAEWSGRHSVLTFDNFLTVTSSFSSSICRKNSSIYCLCRDGDDDEHCQRRRALATTTSFGNPATVTSKRLFKRCLPNKCGDSVGATRRTKNNDQYTNNPHNDTRHSLQRHSIR